jgi:NAD(P) transhydrogenase
VGFEVSLVAALLSALPEPNIPYSCIGTDFTPLPSAADPPEYNYLYGIPGAAFIGGYGYLASTGQYPDIHNLAYLAASLCCVGALTGLSSQKTSRLGNALGMIGVSSGIAATLGIIKPTPEVFTQMAVCMGSGGLLGAIVAKRMEVRQLSFIVCYKKNQGKTW